MGDRWAIERALVGVDDGEHVVILVSQRFDGIPWLERVHQTGSLWDAAEMGAPADVHCYTQAEFDRKVQTVQRVREVAEHGVDLGAPDD